MTFQGMDVDSIFTLALFIFSWPAGKATNVVLNGNKWAIPLLTRLGIDQISGAEGNKNSKKIRFGITGTGLFTAITTGTSRDAVMPCPTSWLAGGSRSSCSDATG